MAKKKGEVSNRTEPLSPKKFIYLWAREAGLNEKTIERAYKGLIKVIASELARFGTLTLVNFGRFYTKQLGGRTRMVPAKGGGMEPKYIESYLKPAFTPSEGLINMTNGRGVTKGFKKRERKNALTATDKEALLIKTRDAEFNIDKILQQTRETGKSIKELSDSNFKKRT